VSKANGFVSIRRGLWDVRDGRMSPLAALAFIYICSQADTRTWIWERPRRGELGLLPRTRDMLERLEHVDYIRRFLRPGERFCYPILVSSTYSNGCLDLKYFPCEVDGKVHAKVHNRVGASQRRSGNTEKRQEKKTDHPKSDDASYFPAQNSRLAPIFILLFHRNVIFFLTELLRAARCLSPLAAENFCIGLT
jgi:hypothetical protein